MSTPNRNRSRLIIEGEHRHWAIRSSSIYWIVEAHPALHPDNPGFFESPYAFEDLTDAYDAYVAAEYADDGTSL